MTALAKPRRIKASHRRRRKVASDHLLYILNNPLSGTDPTGYAACGDVSATEKGSGSCDHTLSNGKTVSVDYKVGKDGGVAISGSRETFGAIIADNAAMMKNGGTSGQTAQGAEPTKNEAADPSKIGSSLPKAENTPMGKDSPKFRSLSGDLTEETYAQNRVVALMFSGKDQSLSSFQWDVRDELIARTNGRGDGTGYEHQASFSEKMETIDGKEVTRYAALIQTSNSPVISTDSERLKANGWKFRNDLGMHTHGFMDNRYRLTNLDVIYLRTAATPRIGPGERGNPRLGGDRFNFSVQDTNIKVQLYLATPDGLKRRYNDGGKWKTESLERPKVK
ncbi:MAG: hypothetical protein KF800_13460 [Lysobacter sp.]|nr:hypothetical protein [Lysobacter sp.]